LTRAMMIMVMSEKLRVAMQNNCQSRRWLAWLNVRKSIG
jgi:hypothetical protein